VDILFQIRMDFFKLFRLFEEMASVCVVYSAFYWVSPSGGIRTPGRCQPGGGAKSQKKFSLAALAKRVNLSQKCYFLSVFTTIRTILRAKKLAFFGRLQSKNMPKISPRMGFSSVNSGGRESTGCSAPPTDRALLLELAEIWNVLPRKKNNESFFAFFPLSGFDPAVSLTLRLNEDHRFGCS
jgi:hypothetical protein